MLEVMMGLGSYRFSLATAAYDQLVRSAEWRWPAQEVIGAIPVRQYTGRGETTISLSGMLYPHYKGMLGLPNLLARLPGVASALGTIASISSVLSRFGLSAAGLAGMSGSWSLQPLIDDADRGTPLLLVDGRGRVWGYWCLLRLQETETFHCADGSSRKIAFDATLAYYGEEAPDAIGGSLMGELRGWLGL
jgi:phage protein U